MNITQPDDDLLHVSNVTYPNKSLFDTVKLVFDITPSVSGPLYFQYVFGSEEYPNYAPGGAQAGAVQKASFLQWLRLRTLQDDTCTSSDVLQY